MSHLEKLCENHCHLHQNHVVNGTSRKVVNLMKNPEESQQIVTSSKLPSFRPSMDWKHKSTRKLPIPIMVPPPPKVLSIRPGKLYQTLEAQNNNLNQPGFNNDISPLVAARRVMKLVENLQFVEAANFVHKLNHSTFKQMLEGFSFQKLIQFIPNSLPAIEAIYSKMFVNSLSEEPIQLEKLHPQEIVDSLINLFIPNSLTETGNVKFSTSMRDKILDESCILSTKRILKVIMLFDNRIRKQLDLKKRKVDRALRGLGHHGLVGTSNDTLIDLHEAVRMELERVGNQYKLVLQKLNESSHVSSTKSLSATKEVSSKTSKVSKGPAPIESSHQRQLSLKLKDIQERLVKNTQLLSVVETTIGNNNHTLQLLLEDLKNRIEMDKEAITQVVQVGKLYNKSQQQQHQISGDLHQHQHFEMSNNNSFKDIIDPETILAPILIKYSAAYSKVLTLFKDLDTEGDKRSPQHRQQADDNVIAYHRHDQILADKSEESELSGDGGSDTISGYHSDSDHSNSNANGSSMNNDIHPSGSIVKSPSSESFGIKTGSEGTTKWTLIHSRRNNSSPDPNEGSLQSSAHLYPQEDVYDDPNPENEFASSPSPDTASTAAGAAGTNHLIVEENDSLRRQLALSRKSLSEMQQRQRILLQRLSNQGKERLSSGSAALEMQDAIRQFENLFTQSRIEVWNTLNILDEDFDYKSNVILSILVTAFNVTRNYVKETKNILAAVLTVDPKEAPTLEFMKQLNNFMVQSKRTLESSKCFQKTWKNVCESFPEMNSLNQSKPLNVFVDECVKFSWSLSIQKPELELGIEDETFLDDRHVHVNGMMNVGSKRIRNYLWPALFDTSSGTHVHKAIVVTM